ncbi:hypothetical protein Tco_0073254 [Tanacetum coccineum]
MRNLFEVPTLQHRTECKEVINAALILEDFNPPLYELPFHKEVRGWSLYFVSSENEGQVYNPGEFLTLKEFILFSPKIYLIGALKLSKVTKILGKLDGAFFLALTMRNPSLGMFPVPLLSP